MEKAKLPEVPKEQVSEILDFIESKMEPVKNDFINTILRDDIFRLLDKQDCIVIYYPKEGEENNGFHVKYPIKGVWKHFVYINTAQDNETQIYASAHELGHVWDLPGWMKKRGFTGDEDWEEEIINRFAAEILMPEKEFLFSANREINMERKGSPENKLTVGNMIRVITAIMDEFFTPYKSVVYRLYELAIIPKRSVEILLYDRDAVYEYSKAIARENGYSRLYQPPDRHRYIEGLKELLDRASASESLPEKWIESFYDRFELATENRDSAFSEVLPDSDAGIEGGGC